VLKINNKNKTAEKRIMNNQILPRHIVNLKIILCIKLPAGDKTT
jgi:hypothetical protein